MTLENATPVSPVFWMIENNRRKQYDYDRGRESTILSIMQSIESRVRKGDTPDTIGPVVATWAGPWSKWIKVDTSKSIGGGQRTLMLTAANPAVVMTLRPQLPALLAQLKPTGITQVRFR